VPDPCAVVAGAVTGTVAAGNPRTGRITLVRTTRSPARRLVAVLLLSLVAALAPIAGSLTAEAVPATAAASVGQDVAPAEAPRPALLGRSAHDGPVAPDATGHPGPALDVLVLDAAWLGHGAPAPAEDWTTTAAPEPGSGADIGSRGPPRA
jgi:hypothetical protein